MSNKKSDVDDDDDMDFFSYLVEQMRQVYAQEYFKAQDQKKSDRATYFRGKLDAYVEIKKHYTELKK